jgi:deoxyribonuclease-1
MVLQLIKLRLLVLLSLLLPFVAHSTPVSDYYDQLLQQPHLGETLKGAKLKDALYQVISRDQNTSFSYRKAREILFGTLHLETTKEGAMVLDVYCRKEFFKDSGVGRGKIPNHRRINCEHTWPQSKFSPNHSKNTQKVDLHHLYPTDARSNSARSNLIFSEVEGKPVNNTCHSSQKGASLRSGQQAFQPPHQHRGNIARAMFYFSTRYQIKIDATQEYYFKKWHREDPVDQQERDRNETIYSIQNNRNPYIDMPELVDTISDF